MKTLKTVTNTPLLDKVCRSSDELQEIIFGGTTSGDEETPLLSEGEEKKRKSSAWSNKFLENRERKLSAYDLE